MVCKKCNAQLAEDAMFCMSCGTKVEVAPVQEELTSGSVFCSKCGKEIEKDSKFCTYCGATAEAQADFSQGEIGEKQSEITANAGAQGNAFGNSSMSAGAQGNIQGYQPANAGAQGNVSGYQPVNAGTQGSVQGYQPANVGAQGNVSGYQPMNSGVQRNVAGYQPMNAGMQGGNLEYQAMNIKTTKRWLKFGIVFLFVLTFFSLMLPAVKFEVTQMGLLGQDTIETESYAVFEMMNEATDSRNEQYYSDVIAAANINNLCFFAFIISAIAVFLDAFALPLINAIAYMLSYLYMFASYEDISDHLSYEMSVGAYVPILLSIIVIVLAIYGMVLKKREKYIASMDYMQR